MDYQSFKNALYENLVFRKVSVSSEILKIDESGFCYSIGRQGKYKKVSFEELEASFHMLDRNGVISRKWFNEVFPRSRKSAPCNFTTIGGLLQHFGLATYSRGKYTKVD